MLVVRNVIFLPFKEKELCHNLLSYLRDWCQSNQVLHLLKSGIVISFTHSSGQHSQCMDISVLFIHNMQIFHGLRVCLAATKHLLWQRRRVSECMHEWLCEWVCEWTSGWVIACVHVCILACLCMFNGLCIVHAYICLSIVPIHSYINYSPVHRCRIRWPLHVPPTSASHRNRKTD